MSGRFNLIFELKIIEKKTDIYAGYHQILGSYVTNYNFELKMKVSQAKIPEFV